MFYFPVRKCYQAFKVGVVVILVVTLLSLFEQWRGGRRSARAIYIGAEAEYEREILEDEARIIPGLGDGGNAAHLVGEEKRLGEESEKKLAINVYLSDRIAYNRTLKDFRNPACSRVVYDAELPSASVILIFHNEPYSVVVRTIWSVVNSARRDQPWFKHANFVDQKTGKIMEVGYPGQDRSSPFVYLKEIILVDDNSTLPELKGKLSHYVRTRLPPDMIRILRLPDRVGLTRARLAGARYAAGDVLVFLDSHCEVQTDWLRPLVSAIKERPHAVVVPIIDVIEAKNFYYSVLDATAFQVGGFAFTGHFTWVDVPEREKKRRGSDIAPTWSPTMAGGLFAIDRAYFWEIGAYDEQMAGWGGENLEMSFRVWQCGGTLEKIPCSRVGHVFRSFHPYAMPANSDTHGINTARMAEVWMDEYAELFYLHRPDLRDNPKIGDVTHRKILREKLQCKNFQWYLDNIYKEKFVPVRDVYGYGRFRNEATQMCLDTLQREGDGVGIGVYPCHAELQVTQYFSLSLSGELRDEFNCAQVQHGRSDTDYKPSDVSRRVVFWPCHGNGREQRWARLPSGQLQHLASQLCLETDTQAGTDVVAKPCTKTPKQIWAIDYTEDNNFQFPDNDLSGEKEKRLNKIRGLRRISRSLLSYADMSGNGIDGPVNKTVRRHSRKNKHHKKRGKKRGRAISKKRTKNKFILKLVRTLMNGTEEHLEVDIHCRHRQLFPNNSFVRDLVTILNEKNVKVINNGRVFERNKVTELGAGDRQKVLTKMDIEGAPEPKPLMKHRQKKHKSDVPQVQTVISQGPILHPLPASEPAIAVNIGEGGAQPDADGDKKIIIEDFVEVKPIVTTEPVKHMRKRKRKRPRAMTTAAETAAAPAAQPDIANGEQLMAMLSKRTPDDRSGQRESVEVVHESRPEQTAVADSAEDAPLLDDSMDKSNTRDDWPTGDSRYRRKESATRRRSDSGEPTVSTHRHHSDTESNTVQEYITDDVYTRARNSSGDVRVRARSEEHDQPAPVKVVMRSNLTFNLGDEFFKWKRSNDEVDQFLGELSIPTNEDRATPTLEAWLRPSAVQPRPQNRQQNVRDQESSSSSDSSSE